MKRVGGILLLSLFGVTTHAQNLVPNPSFEQYVQCPVGLNNFTGHIDSWFNPTFGTPDYFNACSELNASVPYNILDGVTSFQPAKAGDAYVGVLCYHKDGYREYVEIELIAALETDTVYCISFFVSRANFHLTSTSNIAAHLSQFAIQDLVTMHHLNFQPQISNSTSNIISDTVNWTEIRGQYAAQGGEKFITIGNFFPNSETYLTGDVNKEAYYYIDDVSVIKCSQVGTSVQSVAQQLNVQLNPNPVSNELQITINGLVGNAKIEITNVLGQIVFTQNVKATNSFHQAVDVSSLPSGLYMVNIESDGQRVSQKLVKQ